MASARLMAMTPPDPSRPGRERRCSARCGSGCHFRGARRGRHARRSCACCRSRSPTYLEDRLDDDALRALLAARGIRYTSMGPRDRRARRRCSWPTPRATTAAPPGETVYARGGPGALAAALAAAARRLGADDPARAPRCRSISARDERVDGVVLATARSIEAAPSSSAALRPRGRCWACVDPEVLGPQLGWQAGNLRLGRRPPRSTSRSRTCPVSRAWRRTTAPCACAAASSSAPSIGVPRPCRGCRQVRPHQRRAVAGGDHPEPRRSARSSTTPRRGPPRHERARPVGAPFQLREGRLGRPSARRSATASWRSWRGWRPASGPWSRRDSAHAARPRARLGPDRGPPAPWRARPRPMVRVAPDARLARYRMPLEGLYLCASGAHPGGGRDRSPGPQRGARDRRRPQARGRPVSRLAHRWPWSSALVVARDGHRRLHRHRHGRRERDRRRTAPRRADAGRRRRHVQRPYQRHRRRRHDRRRARHQAWLGDEPGRGRVATCAASRSASSRCADRVTVTARRDR